MPEPKEDLIQLNVKMASGTTYEVHITDVDVLDSKLESLSLDIEYWAWPKPLVDAEDLEREVQNAVTEMIRKRVKLK